jgi:hypothetical protein
MGMAWRLRIYNANGTVLKADFNNTNPGGIVGGFEWEVEPTGNCLQMTFKGFANLLPILELDLIDYDQDGVDAFWGEVDLCPDPSDENEGSYVIVGTKRRCKSVIPKRRFYGDGSGIGLADLSNLITRNYSDPKDNGGYKSDFPPGVTYDAALIESPLGTARRFDYSLTELDVCLDRLATISSSPNGPVAWGVGANRKLYFRGNNTVRTAPASARLERQPRRADGVVTAVMIPFAAKNPSASGTKGIPARIDVQGQDGFTNYQAGNPLEYRYADAAHAQYNREKLVQPGQLDLLDRVAWNSVTSAVSFTGDANTNDNDSSTYAFNDGTGVAILFFDATTDALKTVAVEFEYSTDNVPTSGLGQVIASITFGPNPQLSPRANNPLYLEFTLPVTGGHKVRNRCRIYCVYDGLINTAFPHLTVTTVAATVGINSNTSDVLRVYEVRRLIADTTAQRFAQAQIKLPSPLVAKLEVDGLLANAPFVNVGGTVYAASTWKYKCVETEGLDGVTSTVELGAKLESQAARAIRQTAQNLDSTDRADARAYADGRPS